MRLLAALTGVIFSISTYSIGFDFYKVPKSKTLVVAIHGCKQNAIDFVDLTHIKDYQRDFGFDLLAPNQDSYRNPYRCWNWFSVPSSLSFPLSEAGQIVSKIKSLKEIYKYESIKIMGLSSGAAMAFNVAICNRDLIDSVLIHSGVSKRPVYNPTYLMENVDFNTLDSSVFHSLSCDRKSTNHKLKKAFIVQGSRDEVVHPDHGQYIRKHIQKVFVNDFGKKQKVELLQLENLNHAWSGGKDGFDYSDSSSIDVTRLFLENF